MWAYVCTDHEYVWVFLRKICACPFCPAQLMCACEIKGCRPPPVLSSSPSSVARAFSFPPYLFISFSSLPLSLSLFLSLSFTLFFLSLFISAYVDYATMSHTSPPSLFLQRLRNVYQRMRQSRYINSVFFWNVTHNTIFWLNIIIQIMGVIYISINNKEIEENILLRTFAINFLCWRKYLCFFLFYKKSELLI